MNHDSHNIHFGADGHPTLELLRQYQEGLLSPALSHQLERHLLDCELCADIAEGMALSDATQTKAAVADINQRLTIAKEKRRAAAWYADWHAVAAVFVLICSAVMVFYYQYTTLQTTSETIAVEQSETIEPTINYAPPIANLDEEVAEEAQPAQAIVKPRLAPAQTIVAPQTYADTDEDDFFPYDITAVMDEMEVAEKAEALALEEVTFDLKQDSVATIAIAKPKAKATTAAPQMSFERALQGQVAGVALQRNKVGDFDVVQGKVTDEIGNPLPGVTVQVKGTMQGVSTDVNGNFSLQMPEGKNTLTFRYIGFQTKEQQLDSATNLLAVNLQPDNQALSEVVVTGYSKSADLKSVEVSVIEKPEPTIGRRAYKLYLKNEQRLLQTDIKGRVIVGFSVSDNGQLENVRVLRSLSNEADAEAVRLIQQGPAWEPAMQNGNPVEQQVKIVVRFR
ncbi:TonB family protein [Pontibacter populi]|uniref:TonB family protein n=1 Tax=Pontibacter populi TaxID=890055 RepID=A0ABV1RQY1_9BACT